MNTSLTIQDQRLGDKELRLFSKNKIQDNNTPSWEKEVYKFILDWLGPSGSIIQYSSGTTGKSKELRLLKSSMILSAEITCRYFNLAAGQNAVLCLPMNFIAGKMMVVRSFVAGLNLDILEPKSMPDFSGTGHVDFCAMVPLQVTNLLKHTNEIPPVKKWLIGGAEITHDLVSLVNKVPAEFYASFGMAETCSHIAIRRLNGPDRQEDYHALPEVSLTQDERRCLVIEAPYLPGRTVTNDLVDFTGHNSFRWLGRYDNLINSGGIKVAPEELEMQIRNKTGIECAIIGLPDVKLGQRLVLITESSSKTAEGPGLEKVLQDLLPPGLRIREIVRVEKFPRNTALKLDRKKLAGMVNHML